MKNSQQGMTLINLMIITAIIGILGAVALPAYKESVEREQGQYKTVEPSKQGQYKTFTKDDFNFDKKIQPYSLQLELKSLVFVYSN